MDSGAAKHCIPKAALTDEELPPLEPLDAPVSLQTANGVITATHKVKIWSNDLEAYFEFLVLPASSPSVLSMFQLCALDGYSHFWPVHS